MRKVGLLAALLAALEVILCAATSEALLTDLPAALPMDLLVILCAATSEALLADLLTALPMDLLVILCAATSLTMSSSRILRSSLDRVARNADNFLNSRLEACDRVVFISYLLGDIAF